MAIMPKQYTLFSVTGLEFEYMIVDKTTLKPLPICDQVIKKLSGVITTEYALGDLTINNELVLHVLELKMTQPEATLIDFDQKLTKAITTINNTLKTFNACLMPTGAHPFYNPKAGVKLWPHGDREIYRTYQSIFNCEGHGWANLQSMHINLPFSSDAEFAQLHNAIRLLMPIIPALSASTPFIENKATGYLDTRLFYYGKNQQKIPEIAGKVIPEPINSIQAYHDDILGPMFAAISPFDPKKILQEEWLNSRGAIARFDRNAIEIRIVDSQECAKADLAVAYTLIETLKLLVNESKQKQSSPMDTDILSNLFQQTIKNGFNHKINNEIFLAQLSIEYKQGLSVKAIWENLISRLSLPPTFQEVINTILSSGNLSDRLLHASKNRSLESIYHELCDCLAENRLFS